MKLLLVTRLYSGFELSLKNLIWNPEGVPTIYNLINGLADKHKISVIFTAKDSGATYVSNWKETKDKSIKLKNLNAKIRVLSGIYYFPIFLPRKLAMILRDIRQFFCILIYIRKSKPALVYCDSANVVIAYLIKRIYPKIPVVVRVLGVCSFWRSILNSKRLVHKIYKFAFKGNFSTVIGTQDGSGIEYWFKESLKNNVPRYVLLNGVKKNLNIKTSLNHNIKILFVGRLETYKGILVFVKALIKVLNKTKKKIIVTIIGDGTLYKEALNLCKSSGYIKNFNFLKSIPHKDVLNYHSESDIYVSTNTDGNLINTNLEAISSNACMIIPKPQKNKKIDIKTYELLKKSVLYYEVNNSNDLANKIMFLLNSLDNIISYKNKIGRLKVNFIRTWDERVKEEIKILENLANK